MATKADLYDSAYGNYERDVYRQIRVETYGEDLGQTSWVTTQESLEIPKLLEAGPNSRLLEIGCGSGRYALRVAEQTGCSIVGIDINEHGIATAARLADAARMNSKVSFERVDASKNLRFQDSAFDAVFSNDSLCHVQNRPQFLLEIYRILRPQGRFLFSDALVFGGLVSNQELATRSSIGYYTFSPAGENERLLKAAGFTVVDVNDTTAASASIAKRWHDARAGRNEELTALEGSAQFESLQNFLNCVHSLTSERRLLRYVYLACKPA
jgi:SAM-dependent methyltransferase